MLFYSCLENLFLKGDHQNVPSGTRGKRFGGIDKRTALRVEPAARPAAAPPAQSASSGLFNEGLH